MTTPRAITRAAIKTAYPRSLDADVDEFLDILDGKPVVPVVAITAAVPGVVTGDRVPAPAPKAPAAGAGEVAVEVVEATERTYPDSGVVKTLILAVLDDDEAAPVRARFDERADGRWRAALGALGGLADGEPVESLVGRRGIAVLSPYTDKQGTERVGVSRWITAASKARAAKRASVIPGVGGTRRAKPTTADGDDVSF